MNLLAGQEGSRESRLFPIGFFNAVKIPSGLFICLSDINFRQIIFSHLFPHYIYSKTFWKENWRAYLPRLKEPGGLQSKGHQGVELNSHPICWALHGLLSYCKPQFQASSFSSMENVLSARDNQNKEQKTQPTDKEKEIALEPVVTLDQLPLNLLSLFTSFLCWYWAKESGHLPSGESATM